MVIKAIKKQQQHIQSFRLFPSTVIHDVFENESSVLEKACHILHQFRCHLIPILRLLQLDHYQKGVQ